MKLIYKPFGLIAGLIAGLLGRKVFDQVWGLIDDEEPPKGTTQESTWVKIMFAAALQGMIFKAVRVAVDRGAAKGWFHLTGVWPGEQRPDPE